jgi:two-component system sensor histidine kinase BaeS
MRTKLFLAFIFIIFLALLSNLVFERLMIRDFNDFLKGTEEDHIYWVLASVEGSYNNGRWDNSVLNESLHWGLMLGFQAFVEDVSGRMIFSSSDALSSMKPNMQKRMNALLKLPPEKGEFSWYPLYVEGEEIGKLHIRPIEKLGSVLMKEETFRKRGREFLIISFVIAGGGALFLSVLFIIFLSNPIRRLTRSAEKIAEGDLSVEVPKTHDNVRDEIDKLTEAFNYMTEALRREDSVRKHLTSNIAHELRTPLAIIRGNLEGIEDGIISDPDRAIRDINSEIQRIISLVEGIEDITRAEASFFEKGAIEEVNLKEFIGSITGGMRKIIEEKGLYLKADGPDMLIRTYPEKLHIILKNFLTNANKFTGSGGITISWGKNINNEGEGFYISVDDTGEGISEDDVTMIFNRFYKGEGSSGKGLGLAIVKELAEVMGGEVEVESAPGRGARFKVIFNATD